jgi:hypothetical protein
VVGLALGLRRVHVLVELTGAYEGWIARQDGVSLSDGGFVLLPAFAVRVRL